jgi:drug/metabolite transporter (DMT)-like permease
MDIRASVYNQKAGWDYIPACYFKPLIIRYMLEARNYQWQYLFYRGLTIAIILLIYLMVKEGKTFITRFRHTGASGLLGACGLVTAFIGFIWSITLTTVSNSLFMLATAPFVAAFLGIVFLKEKVRQYAYNDRRYYRFICHYT